MPRFLEKLLIFIAATIPILVSSYIFLEYSNLKNVLQDIAGDASSKITNDFDLKSYFSKTLTKVLDSKKSIENNNLSQVLQASDENWDYRFDVNVPSYFNDLMVGSQASFELISVNNLQATSITGLTQLDEISIRTIEQSIDFSTQPPTDDSTFGGLEVTDFLRSNTDTVFSNGVLTFENSANLQLNNISPSTFLSVDSGSNVIGYQILPGLNVEFTSTATSLTINSATQAMSRIQAFDSIAVSSLFYGTSSFDSNFLLLSGASDLNKLYTLSGSLLTTNNLLSFFSAIDTDATNDITNSNFSSTLFTLFPNIDTNASNDVDLLQDAVLIGSEAGKNVYSENIWFGYQNFNRASASLFEVETNGKIQFNGGVLPAIVDNSIYSYDDVIYFQENPIAILSDYNLASINNKFAFFTTNAFGKLQLGGASEIDVNNLTNALSISASSITMALGYTPLKNTSDTMSGSLTILQTLSSQDLIVSNSLLVGDYVNSSYTLQIEPKVGSLDRRIVLDLLSGSQTETTLGMYIQSVKFSAPSSSELKNITFNQISSTNDLIVDFLKAGTLPSVLNGVLDTYNSQVSAASLYLAANTTNTPQIRFTSSAGVNLNSPSAGDLWWNGSNLYFNDGTSNIDIINNVPDILLGATIYSTTATSVPNGGYIELVHNQNSNDILADAWIYNSTTSKWEKFYADSEGNQVIDLMEYSSSNDAQAAYSVASSGVVNAATGGTVTYTDVNGLNPRSGTPYEDGYVVHKFTGVGVSNFVSSQLMQIEYLVVGGGGGGGKNFGGGGGGGQFITNAANVVAGTYSITVGAGGVGGTGNPTFRGGSAGTPSIIAGPSFATVTAKGGGGGGGGVQSAPALDPNQGGNGGGQAANSGWLGHPAGVGQNPGGGATTSSLGGGGGGAGSRGGNATDGTVRTAGDGGTGAASSITGTTVYYAGGGGGGADLPSDVGGIGGLGGGGNGAKATGTPDNGTANTGGGAGGSGDAVASPGINGATGGSGIVVIRYRYSNLQRTTESDIFAQGTRSLKIDAAATSSLNKQLRRDISPTINLSNQNKITFSMRASRTGSNIKIGLRDSSGNISEVTPNITTTSSFEEFTWDISTISNVNKDSINQIIITVVNADADNTVYLDGIVSENLFKIYQEDANTVRLYNYSGTTQDMKLTVNVDSELTFGQLSKLNIGNVLTSNAALNIRAANLNSAQINISSSNGVNVTNPNEGDLWWNGSNLYFNNGTANFDLVASVEDKLGYSPLSNGTDYMRGSLGVTGSFSAAAAQFPDLFATNFSATTGNITNLNISSFSGTSGFLTNFGVTDNFSAANIGVATALSAANGSFTNLNISSFSGTSGFLTNFGVTDNFSAASATLSSALILGNLTASNPAGNTRLNLVSNGGSGNNIELGFYNGANKLANFAMDSTNTFEFEGASGVNVHFNATNGAYRYWVNGSNKFSVESTGQVFVGADTASPSFNLGSNTQYLVVTNRGRSAVAVNEGISGILLNDSNATANLRNSFVIQRGSAFYIGAVNDNFDASYSGFRIQNGVIGGVPRATAIDLDSYYEINNKINNVLITQTNYIGEYVLRSGSNTQPSPVFAYSGYMNTTDNMIRFAGSDGACLGNPGTNFVWTCVSDRSLKSNIVDSTNAIGTLSKFRIRDFTINSTGENTTGVIAQEVQLSFPSMVSEVSEGILGVEEVNPWLLVAGIQEQQAQITSLSNAVAGMNLASMQSVYDQFVTTLENLSMSTEDGALVVNTNLTVTGEALFNNATFTGNVEVGQVKIDSLENDISINTSPCVDLDGVINQETCDSNKLNLMQNKAGNIEMFDGEVKFKPNGEVLGEQIEAKTFKNTPSSAPEGTATCNSGEFKFAEDNGKAYVYFCTSNSEWVRSELSKF